MKTATITWITYNNYGTELQAYALQQYLKRNGIENDIISDEDIIPYKFELMELEKNAGMKKNVLIRVKNILIHPKHNIKKSYNLAKKYIKERSIKPYIESQKEITLFKKRYLNILYNKSREQMPELSTQYDIFISGSDQIWSILDINFDGYYYLNFVRGRKKISYSASVGASDIPEEKANQIREWLSDFSLISVRENITAKQLEKLIGREVYWTVDPTLLFGYNFWNEFCLDTFVRAEHYILCYFLENKQWYFEYAEKLAQKLGVNIVLIPSCEEHCLNKNVYKKKVGPKEFVKLIKDSNFVLTDSYHGTLFSLIFEKQFLYLERFTKEEKNCQNVRVDAIFDRLDLKKCYIEKKEFDASDVKEIDYKKVKNLIDNFRKFSEEYLRRGLFE